MSDPASTPPEPRARPTRDERREQRAREAEQRERDKAAKKAARLAKRKEDPRLAGIGRALTLIGHLGLIALLTAWFTFISPPEVLPRVLPLVLLVGPLLIPLRGTLNGRRYTHQWIGFMASIYFAGGIDAWANPRPGNLWLGVLLTLLSAALFVGSVMVARYTPSPVAPLHEGEPSPGQDPSGKSERRW